MVAAAGCLLTCLLSCRVAFMMAPSRKCWRRPPQGAPDDGTKTGSMPSGRGQSGGTGAPPAARTISMTVSQSARWHLAAVAAAAACMTHQRTTHPPAAAAARSLSWGEGQCQLTGRGPLSRSLSEIMLPPNLTEIERSAFNQCTSLSEIALPPNLTEIGDFAFRFCTSLSEITLPPNLAEIGVGTFSRCTSLKNITLPPNYFHSCTSLSEITMPPTLTEIRGCPCGGCKVRTY